MKKMKLLCAAMILGFTMPVMAEDSITITGAGATFPDPIYSQWSAKYQNLGKIRINYQPIGSGAGIAQIKAKTVDFGASDAPLTAKELQQIGLVQYPMVIGGVVPVIHVGDVSAGQLKLTPEILADIYLGKITRWNDRVLQENNPDLKLPDKAITVVHRADGSGTTWLFTTYLDGVSRTWHEKVGAGKSVSWPVGVGGKGNPGVANYVQRIDGSIGYVEYTFAAQNKMIYTQMKNKSGKFVSPTIKSFQAAAANADWKNAKDYYVVLTDQKGEDSWPITGASFILIYRNQPDVAKARAMLKYFDWCYRHGADMAIKLDYVPIPKNVTEMVSQTWSREVRSANQQIWP